VSQRLVENATVLHVGTFPLEVEVSAVAPAPEQGAGAQTTQGQTTQQPAVRPPDIVTLIVTPQDALALNWAIRAGVDLAFALRAPGDATITETTAVTLEYLMQNYQIGLPPRLPFGMEPRIDRVVVPVLPNDTAVPATAQ
jgi:pilus assembly protein CpaB